MNKKQKSKFVIIDDVLESDLEQLKILLETSGVKFSVHDSPEDVELSDWHPSITITPTQLTKVQ